MTSPAHPTRSPRRLPVIALAALALLAAACGAPPSPGGWAPALPVKVGSADLVLVTHKSHVYALPDQSSNATWQFPPKDKTGYPVSESAGAALNAEIARLNLDATATSSLKTKVADLHVSGPSITALKDAISATSASDADRSKLKSAVDSITKFESGALGKIQAIYGDIGLSPDKKTAFVAGFKGVLFALDTTNGRLRWLRDDSPDGIVGGIATDDGTIYYGTKGKHVFALDAATGVQKWQFNTKGEVWATPTLSSDTVYVSSLDGSLYALDKSGGQRWRFSGAGSGVAAKPVVSGDAVYIGAFDSKLYSVKTSDGSLNWSLKGDNWFWATPVVSGGTVYAAALDGKVYAVDVATGAARWDRPFNAGEAVRSGPVIAGGGLIVAARNGRVFKLDLATGKASDASPVVLVNTKILADLTTDATGKTVYIVPDSATLYTLDAENLGLPGNVPLPQ